MRSDAKNEWNFTSTFRHARFLSLAILPHIEREDVINKSKFTFHSIKEIFSTSSSNEWKELKNGNLQKIRENENFFFYFYFFFGDISLRMNENANFVSFIFLFCHK